MAGDNHGLPFPGAILLGPMKSVFDAMANWAAANHRRANEPDAGLTLHAAPGAHHDLSTADLLLPVGQAMMIATHRSVSYWLGLAHILQSHQMTLTEVMSAAAIDRQAAGSE